MPRTDWNRENLLLRMLIMGPTGSGKSLAALALASTIFGGELKKAAIDTEHGRLKQYADLTSLDGYSIIEGDYSPDTYIKEVEAMAADFPGGVLVIDSATHEWSGTGGILEVVDRGAGGNWKVGTPLHNTFVEALMKVNMHLIVCVRSKMKWEFSTDGSGKRKQVLLGLGPDQRDSFLYEFDMRADIDLDTHTAEMTGRRHPLVGKTVNLVPNPDDLTAKNEVADVITEWVSKGLPPAPVEAADEKQVIELRGMLVREGHSEAIIDERFAVARRQNRGQLHPDYVTKQIAAAKERAAKKQPKPASAPTGGSETKDERAPTQAKTKKSEPVAA